jgi:cell division protease FtsH
VQLSHHYLGCIILKILRGALTFMNKLKKKYLLIPIIVAILSLAALAGIKLLHRDTNIKPYNDFLGDLNNKQVSTVYLTNTTLIDIVLKDGTRYKTDNPKSNNFKETLLSAGIKVSEKTDAASIETIPAITLGLSLLTILILFLRSSSLGTKGMNSVDALDAQAVSNNKLNFESVAGNEEAKESVKDIVDFLKNPEKYNAYGARMPRGIILYGEPGTGKTLIAKAVAGEANVPFYAMSGSDFVQVYVGVGASRIRSLFKKAKSHGKAVIFIDEIDAIGKARDNGKLGGSDERDQTLNALLTEMSGFNENEGIVVMAATNRLDMLDPALIRPGRFDRHIEVMLPDISAREKILNLHLRNKPLSQDADIKSLAHKTAYFSGAKLESLVNEAAILACKEDSGYINSEHLDKAFIIVVAGHEKMNREGIKERDKKITAYHEAGHALISMLVLPQDKVSKVTIIPSTKGAGGYTLSIPEDNMYQTMEYLKNRIMVLLGGRAAEEIIFGKEAITTGAYSDLQHSTNLITKMVTEYGMGEALGLLNLQQLSSLSNINSEIIIYECKEAIDNLYSRTKELLTKERASLENITNALLEKETLLSDDLESLLS